MLNPGGVYNSTDTAISQFHLHARLADTDFAEKISSWGQVGESSEPQ